VLLAAPALSMRLGFTTDADAEAGSTQRTAYDMVSQGFGPGQNGPLLLTISLPDTTSADVASELAVGEKLLAAVKATRGIESVTPPLPNPAQDAAVAPPSRLTPARRRPGAHPDASQRGDPQGDQGHLPRVRSTMGGVTVGWSTSPTGSTNAYCVASAPSSSVRSSC
jgi:uncharacterized membrane protein YdfJ with MMPL/SSD domain